MYSETVVTLLTIDTGHYYLWVGSIEHNDISVRNLMYAWDGNITRLYRHDCESFAWVLLWISCRYDNGKEIRDPPLGEFITGDYNRCFLEKHAIISKLKDIAATPSYESSWDASVSLITLFDSQRYQRELNALRQDSSPSEQAIDEIVHSCQKAMEGKGVYINLPSSLPHNLDG